MIETPKAEAEVQWKCSASHYPRWHSHVSDGDGSQGICYIDRQFQETTCAATKHKSLCSLHHPIGRQAAQPQSQSTHCLLPSLMPLDLSEEPIASVHQQMETPEGWVLKSSLHTEVPKGLGP